jgi:glycerophosphoryl diester phosphodiesterase
MPARIPSTRRAHRATLAGMLGGLTSRSLGMALFTLALVGVGGLLMLQAPPADQGDRGPDLRFDAQGHRGARGAEPANTLPAFRHALATGVTTLELDVHLTAGGVPVAHHDPRLDPARTRGPDGDWIAAPGPAVGALPIERLQRYDVGRAKPGSRLAERFPDQAARDGVEVPTLRDVTALGDRLSGGAVRYNIETKVTPEGGPAVPPPAEVADAILAVMRDAGALDRTTIQSFDWRSLGHVRETAPQVARAYLTAERPWLNTVQRGRDGASPWLDGLDVDAHGASVPRSIAAAETPAGEEYAAPPPWRVVWAPYFRDLRPRDLRQAQNLGLKVVVWTVNEQATMERLIEAGVDGIITDYPGRLRAALRAQGRPLPPAYPGE